MNAKEFNDALQALRLTPEAFARVFCVNESNAQRWSSGKHTIPFSVAKLLGLVVNGTVLLSDVCTHGCVAVRGDQLFCADCGVELALPLPRNLLHLK